MLDLIKQYPITCIAVILVILAGLVGTIIGIIFYFDKGFIKKDGHYLHWNAKDFPLKLSYTDKLPPALILTIKAVCSDINGFIGTRVFDLTLLKWESTEKTVSILFDTLSQGEIKGGDTDLRWNKADGHLLSAEIKINVIDTSPYTHPIQAKNIVTHEIGHALGLQHDDKKTSIMHDSIGSIPLWFTERDMNRLSKRYGA